MEIKICWLFALVSYMSIFSLAGNCIICCYCFRSYSGNGSLFHIVISMSFCWEMHSSGIACFLSKAWAIKFYYLKSCSPLTFQGLWLNYMWNNGQWHWCIEDGTIAHVLSVILVHSMQCSNIPCKVDCLNCKVTVTTTFQTLDFLLVIEHLRLWDDNEITN